MYLICYSGLALTMALVDVRGCHEARQTGELLDLLLQRGSAAAFAEAPPPAESDAADALSTLAATMTADVVLGAGGGGGGGVASRRSRCSSSPGLSTSMLFSASSWSAPELLARVGFFCSSTAQRVAQAIVRPNYL